MIYLEILCKLVVEVLEEVKFDNYKYIFVIENVEDL